MLYISSEKSDLGRVCVLMQQMEEECNCGQTNKRTTVLASAFAEFRENKTNPEQTDWCEHQKETWRIML